MTALLVCLGLIGAAYLFGHAIRRHGLSGVVDLVVGTPQPSHVRVLPPPPDPDRSYKEQQEMEPLS